MSFIYLSLERPKKAARRLSKALPDVPLAVIQQGVARAVGYADWHALERNGLSQNPGEPDETLSEAEFHARALAQVSILSAHLGAPAGDVQYALAGARLTGDRPWTLEDHLAVRTAGWRAGPLAGIGPRRRGDLVKIKAEGRPAEYGYLLRLEGGTARVLLDDSILLCADFEVVRPRVRPADFVPARYWLPYGYWTLEDGGLVVFSRDYFPLWHVSSGGVERLPPWLWIGPKDTETHFHTQTGDAGWRWPRARAAALQFLQRHGVQGLPILADAPLHYFATTASRPEHVVALEHRLRGSSTSAPDYARVRRLSAAPLTDDA